MSALRACTDGGLINDIRTFTEENSMLDFILSIFSAVLGMNMKDPHDIPFALPLVMASVTGLIIGFTILSFIGNENREDRKKQEDSSEES